MRKVLITGGAGFIGGHLAERLASSGVEVLVLDQRADAAPPGVRAVQGCITDRSLVEDLAAGCDALFHLAAMVSVVQSMGEPEECVRVNVLGTLRVLEAARRQRVGKVVMASSAAVYGDLPGSPKREGDPTAPVSPYGVSKLDGEHYLEIWRREHGLPTVSLRFFNAYGPRQDPDSVYANVIPAFIRRCFRGQDLLIHGDGRQTRDFVYVDDLVEACVRAAETPEMLGVYNVARGESTSVLALAEAIRAQAGSSSQFVHGPSRAGDLRHSVADISRLRQAGFEPRWSLEEGLRATIEWFRSVELPAAV